MTSSRKNTKKKPQKRGIGPILKGNLEALDKRQPLFAKKIREHLQKGERFNIEQRQNPQGTWWKGLYPKPFFESHKALEATPEGRKPVLILAGIGSPQYLTTMLNRSKKRQILVLLEADLRMFLFALETVPFFAQAPPFELYFLLGGDSELAAEMHQKAYGHRGHFLGGLFDVHAHPGEMEICADPLRTALKDYVAKIDFQMKRLGDSAEDTLLGIRQMALATPRILHRESLNPLKGRFKGFSGIVLSAGPSLDKNLHLLKGREDEFVIVAADTLMGKLLAQGIRPHFVCALERGSVTYEKYFRPHYAVKEPGLQDITLVVQSVCFPQIAGQWPGRVCVVGKDSINLDRKIIGECMEGTVLPSGASVAHMAMGLLDFLGVDRIALVGQDLAFGPDGATHANQTVWDTTGGGEKNQARVTVPAALGGTVETTKVWKFFIDVFSDMIPQMACPVWDCTEGGAHIPGARIAPLEHYLGKKSQKGSYGLVEDIFQSHLGEPDLKAVEERLLSVKANFADSLAHIEKGRGVLYNLQELPPEEALPREDISRFYDILQELSNGNPLLTYIGQSYLSTLLGSQAALNLENPLEREEWLHSHREFFRAQEHAAGVFCDWLEYMIAVTKNPQIFTGENQGGYPHDTAVCQSMKEMMEKEQNAPLPLEEMIFVDFLHSSVDPVSGTWQPEMLWALGRHLQKEGRYLEAFRHLQAAMEGFEGTAMDKDAIVALLKDRALALMGRDLCWPGYAKEALVSLGNAYGYAPEDAEILRLLEALLSRRLEDIKDLLIREAVPEKRIMLNKIIEELGKDLERLRTSGEEREEILRRYLVAIFGNPEEEEAVPL